MPEQHYCEKCNRTMSEKQFYRSNNLEKYPHNGLLSQCKQCITMHVDNWNPDTFLWILQEADVPYIPDEWHKLMASFAKDKSVVTGMTILGRYLSKMKLNQFKNYRWKDNEFIQELNNSRVQTAMAQQGYDSSAIAQAIAKRTYDLPTGELNQPIYVEDFAAPASPIEAPPPPDDYFSQPEDDTQFDDDLTEEDRLYLRLKWGKTYRPEEWVKLEQLYEEMMNSYDIQAAGDINTLKLACKCSLKANQLLDIGDIDGAQKATKMYDSLMKSGKWTAAQNKAEADEVVDSVGELVALCERDGFIPKYYTAGPQDHVDRVIEDMQRYTHDLIENESGLSQMIETALKQITEEEERIKAAAEAEEEDDESKLFNYDAQELDDSDFTDFQEFQDELSNEDNDFLRSLLEEDDE